MRRLTTNLLRGIGYPFLLILIGPVAFGTWRAYKVRGRVNVNFFKYFWIRNFGTPRELSNLHNGEP